MAFRCSSVAHLDHLGTERLQPQGCIGDGAAIRKPSGMRTESLRYRFGLRRCRDHFGRGSSCTFDLSVRRRPAGRDSRRRDRIPGLRSGILRLHCRIPTLPSGDRRFRHVPSRLRDGLPRLRLVHPWTGLRRVARRLRNRESSVRLLFRGIAGAGLQLASPLVGEARKLRIDVPEVGVGDGVRPAFQRYKQNRARIVQPAFHGVENREVVVRLGHVGMVAAQRLEDVDGLAHTSLAGTQHSVQHAGAGIVRFALQQWIEHLPGFRIALLGRKRERALEGRVAERGAGREDRSEHPEHEHHLSSCIPCHSTSLVRCRRDGARQRPGPSDAHVETAGLGTVVRGRRIPPGTGPSRAL